MILLRRRNLLKAVIAVPTLPFLGTLTGCTGGAGASATVSGNHWTGTIFAFLNFSLLDGFGVSKFLAQSSGSMNVYQFDASQIVMSYAGSNMAASLSGANFSATLFQGQTQIASRVFQYSLRDPVTAVPTDPQAVNAWVQGYPQTDGFSCTIDPPGFIESSGNNICQMTHYYNNSQIASASASRVGRAGGPPPVQY